MLDEKKLRELLKILYTKEIIGKNLCEKLYNYPELVIECDKLIEAAYIYEVAIINKSNTLELKELVTQQILMVHTVATNIPDYKRSELYFDELGNLTYLY